MSDDPEDQIGSTMALYVGIGVGLGTILGPAFGAISGNVCRAKLGMLLAG